MYIVFGLIVYIFHHLWTRVSHFSLFPSSNCSRREFWYRFFTHQMPFLLPKTRCRNTKGNSKH